MDNILLEISQKYGTPFYLLDKKMLKSRLFEIQKRLPENVKLCYAMKANPFLADFLKDEEVFFEVCSPGELSICEKIGLNPLKIVFSGVVKTFEDIKRAYCLKVNTITLESVEQCNSLLKVVKNESPHEQNVILRLTSGNQFGMCSEDLENCVKLIMHEPSLQIKGVHFFTGTQKKIKTISDEICYIEGYCKTIIHKFNLNKIEIEYGAGLPYDYFSGKDESANFTVLEEFSKVLEKSDFNYIIELGRYIASPCAKYVTKIVDIKCDGKNRYCLIDGGINHVNYFGQMMGMRVPKVDHVSNANLCDNLMAKYTIAGSLCTSADIVVRQIPLKSPVIGDFLVFNDIGAYSITEGLYLFLSHPLPVILCRDADGVRLLRKMVETYIINS